MDSKGRNRALSHKTRIENPIQISGDHITPPWSNNPPLFIKFAPQPPPASGRIWAGFSDVWAGFGQVLVGFRRGIGL